MTMLSLPSPLGTRYLDLPVWPGVGLASAQALPVYVQPPAAGEIRVRRLIHRGTAKPVYKFHSVRLGRMVHTESPLELDMAILLDACAGVRSFGEQPVHLRYWQRDVLRRHVPDFRVHYGSVREFVEIKYIRDVDAEVIERTELLAQALARLGWGYRLLTESELHQGAWLKNARSLLKRGRQRAPEAWALKAFHALEQSRGMTLGDFSWHVTGSDEGAWLAHEIVAGRLHVDMSQPLRQDTPVHARPQSQGGLPWRLAISA